MTDLANQLKTFFVGTERELFRDGVEGANWMVGYWCELFGSPFLYSASTTNIQKYVFGCLIADSAVRFVRHMYRLCFESEDFLARPTEIHPGIIGTAREIGQHFRTKYFG